MKRRTAFAAVVAVTIIVAAALLYANLTKTGKELPTSVEHMGGRYNVTLSFYEDGHGEIEYTDESGNHSGKYFEPQMRTGLDWIKNNTLENATFLCWWDYGHMIKGYASRNVIARNPSHEWINMTAESWRSHITEFDPNEKIVDVAKALATSDATETIQIMEKYSATYVVVYKEDGASSGKAAWMYKVAGFEPYDYLMLQDSTWFFNSLGTDTMISRLLDNRDTGFTLVYEDTAMKVYRKD